MEEQEDGKKVIMVVQEGCPYCAKAQEDYKEDIEKGKIIVKEVHQPDSQEMLRALKIRKVPACVIYDEKNKKYEYCSEEERQRQMADELQEQQHQEHQERKPEPPQPKRDYLKELQEKVLKL